ncbi:MAG: YcxB family protein [Hydrogenophaga sp.]|nr:YcxB family protein [Hydrogenophaga sp.]
MNRQATLNFTPALVRRAVWAYWTRSVGITWPLMLVLLTAYIVHLVREGNTHWTVGVFGTLVAMGYVYLAAIYWAHLRQGMDRLSAMGTPQGTLAMDEAGIALTSGAGQSRLPWHTVQEVWRYPDFWIVLLSRSSYFTLPLVDLPEDMRAELLARVRAHGGKTR